MTRGLVVTLVVTPVFDGAAESRIRRMSGLAGPPTRSQALVRARRS
jgi:hypothetical protein